MVVVRFLVEFQNNVQLTVPISITAPAPPLRDFLVRLRDKCGFQDISRIKLKYQDFSPVVPERWKVGDDAPSPHDETAQIDKPSPLFLYAIVDEEASPKALQYQDNMRRTIRSNSTIAAAAAPSTTSKPADSETSVRTINPNSSCDGGGSSKSAAAAPAAAATATGSNDGDDGAVDDDTASHSSEDSDYDTQGGAHVSAEDAVHFISHGDKSSSTAVSRVAAGVGKILCQETPELAPMYPGALVDLVRRDPRFKSWTHLVDPNLKIEQIESTVAGVDTEEFSKLLYIAKRRGHALPVRKDEETEVAFYSYIDAIPHSCLPSTVLRLRSVKRAAAAAKQKKSTDDDAAADDADAPAPPTVAPPTAVLRCIRAAGMSAGDKLSVALPRAATMDFMLLPTRRRRWFLQQQYGFIDPGCVCERCTGRVSQEYYAIEESLTGAFFLPLAKVNSSRVQARLIVEMKKDFDELGIVAVVKAGAKKNYRTEPLVMTKDARAGKIAADKVQLIYDFLFKYSYGLPQPMVEAIVKQRQLLEEKAKHVNDPVTAAAVAVAAVAALTTKNDDGDDAENNDNDDNDEDAEPIEESDLSVKQKQQEDADAEEQKGNSNSNQEQQQEQQQPQPQQQQQQQQPTKREDKTPRLKLHSNHWRLSFARIALLAFLFPPAAVSKVPQTDGTGVVAPTRHPSVKLDHFVTHMLLRQIDVESAVLASAAAGPCGSAHPLLGHNYIVFRHVITALPEKLSLLLQKEARNLKYVDWMLIERIATNNLA